MLFGTSLMIALYMGYRLVGPLLGYVRPGGFPLTQALFFAGVVLFVAGGFTLAVRVLDSAGVTTLSLAGAVSLLVGGGILWLGSDYSIDPPLKALAVTVGGVFLAAGVLMLSTGVVRLRWHEEA